MAEEGHVTGSVINDSNGSSQDNNEIHSKIKAAMLSRIPHFRKQLDSLTPKGVRRVLEKDLELKEFAMDIHKKFIKECFDECLESAEDENEPKSCGDTAAESPNQKESKDHINEVGSENEEKMEESPVLGLLTDHKPSKSETKNSQSVDDEVKLDESMIKKAIGKRSAYIKANLENMTMAGLRRLLEDDLKLEIRATDPFKKFISKELDKIIASFEASENSGSDKEEDEVKPKKKIVSKGKTQHTGEPKKRKKPENDSKVSSKKNIKPKKTKLEENTNDKDDVADSEDDNSQSSAEKPVKKKEVSTPAYGKRVEHLKSVIKACGLSVPPVIYKKVKQAAEEKREARLIKELEEILSKEGLSSSPSEKEIKEVRKKKEKAKELEGIDTSNIISSSRRRSRASFVPPPKPLIPDESDNSENSDENNDDNDEDNDVDGSESESESEEVPNEDNDDEDSD